MGEEVEIKEDDYELIPMSPIRRLEKRLDRVEEMSVPESRSAFKDVLEIVRMNQLIVDQLAKSNDSLKIELSKLPGKIDQLVMELKELVGFIKASGQQEQQSITKESLSPLLEKLDELVKSNKAESEKNESMLELLDKVSKRLSPAPRPVMPQQRPIPQMRPLPMPQRPIPKQSGNPIKKLF